MDRRGPQHLRVVDTRHPCRVQARPARQGDRERDVQPGRVYRRGYGEYAHRAQRGVLQMERALSCEVCDERSAECDEQQRSPHSTEWRRMDREELRVGHEQPRASGPCIGVDACHQCRQWGKLSRSTVSERQACDGRVQVTQDSGSVKRDRACDLSLRHRVWHRPYSPSPPVPFPCSALFAIPLSSLISHYPSVRLQYYLHVHSSQLAPLAGTEYPRSVPRSLSLTEDTLTPGPRRRRAHRRESLPRNLSFAERRRARGLRGGH